MSTDFATAPTKAQRFLGIVLSLVATIALCALGALIVLGLMASGERNLGAATLILSGILFLILVSLWLFYRFAFTKPRKLGRKGLYAVSGLLLACAAIQIAIGFATEWQSFKQAAAALGFAVAAFVLARSGRDA